MRKLNLESKKQAKREQEIIECGERMLEETKDIVLPLGYEGISVIDELEVIDDDDLALIEAARSQAEDVAGMSKHSMTSSLPLEITEPPQGFAAENISSSSLVFQELDEIEDKPLQEDSELQLEFERLAKQLENYF